MRLELFHGLGRVIDKCKAGSLATTELRPQAEDIDLILCRLVERCKLVAELFFRDVGTSGVEDIPVAQEKSKVISKINSSSCC